MRNGNNSLFERFEKTSRTNWWYIARLELITQIFKDFYKGKKILDLCGGVASVPEISLEKGFVLLDSSNEAVGYCKSKNINALEGDATKIPFGERSFDVVLALDALEHIPDDAKALSEIYRIIKKDGRVLISVPAFQSLWRQSDLDAGHLRRYSKKEIINKIEKAGFKAEKIFYWNFFLFFPLWIKTKLEVKPKKRKVSQHEVIFGDELEVNKVSNKILLSLLRVENFLIRNKLNFPFGVSLFLYLKKI
ncbi:MAG: class I SAM-dependent methyltransferase [Candidatus Diapherotrites archaeon]